MFERCPGKVKECQQPAEYERFEEEFLTDIKATIAAMEEVCPVAQKKSLKTCPVFDTFNMAAVNNVVLHSGKTTPVIVNDADENSTKNTFNANDDYEIVKNKKGFEKVLHDSKNETIIDNLHMKPDENISVDLYENMEDLINLFWNKSETNDLEVVNISIGKDTFKEDKEELSRSQEIDISSTINIIMIYLLIIFIIVLFIVCTVQCSQTRCLSKFRLQNQKFIRRL